MVNGVVLVKWGFYRLVMIVGCYIVWVFLSVVLNICFVLDIVLDCRDVMMVKKDFFREFYFS